ncbi:MAG TPA: hydroxyacid dehydrogenase [Acidimicrobiales bacterium]|nr:hydroxyacid dehydrogenase [Acidimicrobiales bacterium]
MVNYEAEPWQCERLGRVLAGVPCRYVEAPLNEETVDQVGEAPVVSVFIRSRLTPAVIERMPGVRLVATRSTGYDHIDLAACARSGITVCNVPTYGENTVAEHTFSLILALSRRLGTAMHHSTHGDFSLSGLMGSDLRGKTLGVVGAGNIGLHVIRIGRAFGMEVLAYDVRPQPLLAEVLGFRYASLDELLSSSDVVSLHVPYRPETHHLLDRERIGTLKRGALVVNTARGALVDTVALLEGLETGRVGGAALDVIEGEEQLMEEAQFHLPDTEEKLRQLLTGHVLARRDNVILTPHMAWYSREALERILDTTASNIAAFLAGTPANVVSPGS